MCVSMRWNTTLIAEEMFTDVIAGRRYKTYILSVYIFAIFIGIYADPLP